VADSSVGGYDRSRFVVFRPNGTHTGAHVFQGELRGVEVNLPVASRSQEIASDRIFVNVPLSFKDDRRVFIGQDAVRVDVLTERMRQMMVNRTDRQVFLRGDGGIELQELLDIMDRLKAAGVEKVGIVSKLPGEQ